MPMPITKESYQDLKEYWDFQRKIQYNKEKIRAVAEQFENRIHNQFGAMNLNDLYEMLWGKCTEADYDEPNPNWIPEDEKLRFWWEGEPKPHHLAISPPMKKGRPVVLRAKNFDELDSKIRHIFDDDQDIDKYK
jgi:hypothetical protein